VGVALDQIERHSTGRPHEPPSTTATSPTTSVWEEFNCAHRQDVDSYPNAAQPVAHWLQSQCLHSCFVESSADVRLSQEFGHQMQVCLRTAVRKGSVHWEMWGSPLSLLSLNIVYRLVSLAIAALNHLLIHYCNRWYQSRYLNRDRSIRKQVLREPGGGASP